MKKTLLVLALAAAGIYVWNQSGHQTALPFLASNTAPVAGGGARSYADGTYTGPATNAYYGTMQIQAIVHGGKLANIRVLQYPNDRNTSIAINSQALPMLRNEVIAAQSANVDIISGATLSSDAFIRSLGGALNKAG